MILDGETDGNRPGNDTKSVIILSKELRIKCPAESAEIAEILRSKESRNQGKANAQKFPNS